VSTWKKARQMSKSSDQSASGKLAGMVTVALSLTTAGYQYNRSELLEMQSGLKRQANELSVIRLHNERDNLNKQIEKLSREKSRLEQGEKDKEALQGCKSQKSSSPTLLQQGVYPASENCLSYQENAKAAARAATLAGTTTTTSPTTAPTPALPTIYIQVGADRADDIKKAQRLRTALREAEYTVPQIELIKTGMPKGTEIRYVYAADEKRAIALLKVLEQLDVPDISLKDPLTQYANGKVPANVMELWLSTKKP
jgi:hypothetical protein